MMAVLASVSGGPRRRMMAVVAPGRVRGGDHGA